MSSFTILQVKLIDLVEAFVPQIPPYCVIYNFLRSKTLILACIWWATNSAAFCIVLLRALQPGLCILRIIGSKFNLIYQE